MRILRLGSAGSKPKRESRYMRHALDCVTSASSPSFTNGRFISGLRCLSSALAVPHMSMEV